MVLLAVDYGDVRTGIAACDKMQLLASPVCTITQNNREVLIEQIIQIARERKAEAIVVGEPVNMDGSRGWRAQACAEFAQQLQAASGLPCHLYDERCTTMMAHNALNMTNTRGKKRKAVVDTLSAVMILEGFMARHPVKGDCQ
ncbi:MAG: Holliday junction resolvase RuvX [Clostridia bacterium]|nr:Holliday junction resolvase RuvX [Clostridia bacterium]